MLLTIGAAPVAVGVFVNPATFNIYELVVADGITPDAAAADAAAALAPWTAGVVAVKWVPDSGGAYGTLLTGVVWLLNASDPGAFLLQVNGNVTTVLEWDNAANAGALALAPAATGAVAPVLGEIDGYAGVDFSGGASLVARAGAPAPFLTNESLITVVVRLPAEATFAVSCLFSLTLNGEMDGVEIAVAVGGTVGVIFAGSAGEVDLADTAFNSTGATSGDSAPIIVSVNHNGTAAQIYINGAAVGGSTGGYAALAGSYLAGLGAAVVGPGAPLFSCNCTIHEVIVSDAADASTIAALASALAITWGVDGVS